MGIKYALGGGYFALIALSVELRYSRNLRGWILLYIPDEIYLLKPVGIGYDGAQVPLLDAGYVKQ